MAMLTGWRQAASGGVLPSHRAQAVRATISQRSTSRADNSMLTQCRRVVPDRAAPRARAGLTRSTATHSDSGRNCRTARDSLLIPARTAREWPMEEQP